MESQSKLFLSTNCTHSIVLRLKYMNIRERQKLMNLWFYPHPIHDWSQVSTKIKAVQIVGILETGVHYGEAYITLYHP